LKLLADKVSLTEARRKARPWMKRVGLDRHRDQMPTQLSGGERQRVAVARAVANEPRLLLADEPTGSLDTQRSLDILELLRHLAHENGMAILLATHDPQAAEVADRSLTLRDGKLQAYPPAAPAMADPVPLAER
jgi:putative ABC transport system ATP-binding protein